MRDVTFSQVNVGDELPEVACVVSQEVIDRYAVASLDYNPVHTNIEWCRRARVFGTPQTVAHGMFTMSLMASVVLRAWGAASVGVRSIEAKFTKPVEVGSRFKCLGRVKELHPIGPGRNFVVVELQGVDSNDAIVAVGSAQVALPD